MWKGCRSQITNGGVYAICLLVLVGIIVGGMSLPMLWLGAVLPLLWTAWVWISTTAEGFELTTERLRVKRGVFNQVFDEVELYRVKEVSLSRSVFERMLGLGTVTMETSDRGQEKILIPSVRKSDELREHLRTQVEIVRDRKRVREFDTADTHIEL